jgi:hypothetical protein
MGEACLRDFAVNLGLLVQVNKVANVSVSPGGQYDIHLGDVDLDSQRGKGRDVDRN